MGETTSANGATPPAAVPTLRRNDVSMTDMSDIDSGDRLYHVRKSRLIRLINWWQVTLLEIRDRTGRVVGDNCITSTCGERMFVTLVCGCGARLITHVIAGGFSIPPPPLIESNDEFRPRAYRLYLFCPVPACLLPPSPPLSGMCLAAAVLLTHPCFRGEAFYSLFVYVEADPGVSFVATA